MTDKKLKELLAVIDNRYGRVRSKEECIIEIKTCVQAFGMVPDEIVEKALYAASTSATVAALSPLEFSTPRWTAAAAW